MPLPALAYRLVAVIALFGLCASCTSKSADTTPDTTSGSPATTSPATAPQITLTGTSAPFKVTIAQLEGGVHRAARRHLRDAIGAPVAAWFKGGFLAPTYPTASFPDAFASWTKGAAQQAARDGDITTNATLGSDLVAVMAAKQKATLYVFAHAGVTGGATARVRLGLTGQMQDGSIVHYAVSGEVYLTRDGGRWSIFGYDLQQSKAAS